MPIESHRDPVVPEAPSVPLEDRVVDLSNELVRPRQDSIRQLGDIQLMMENKFEDEYMESVRRSTVKKEEAKQEVGFWDDCYGLSFHQPPKKQQKVDASQEEFYQQYKFTMMGGKQPAQDPKQVPLKERDFSFFAGARDSSATEA